MGTIKDRLDAKPALAAAVAGLVKTLRTRELARNRKRAQRERAAAVREMGRKHAAYVVAAGRTRDGRVIRPIPSAPESGPSAVYRALRALDAAAGR